jgi:translation initiation factor IF-1
MSNERDDHMELEGTVIETNKGVFKVKVSDNHFVNAKISGKLKMHEIKVIVGDQVIVQVSPYDMSVGRISKRLRQNI